MTTNVVVRDLDLPVLNATDSRRLEVVVDGLPLFGGSQLAVDTMVCSLHSDGSLTEAQLTQTVWFGPGGAKRCGTQSWCPGSRARLVVLALEVGGRWSPETRTFVAQLARRKPDGSRPSCRRGPSRLGGCGGVQSSRAQQRRPSRHVSWASGAHMGLTGTLLSVGRWRQTTATLGWLLESGLRRDFDWCSWMSF